MDSEAPTLPTAALPAGSRILHIGPSKTGTTALQGACWAARPELERQGVHYAGNRRHTATPARAVAGTPALARDDREAPPIKWWTWLVREMRRSTASRVLYSSEFLAHADDAAVRRILSDTGPDVQVVITLRQLDAILASKWQQAVQAGNTRTLDEWLKVQFAEGSDKRPSSQWQMHHHGRLVERWATVAGPDRVTIVVADPRNHDFLFRAFDGLLGLRPGTLQPVEDLQNRSLSHPEVELIRQLNVQAAGAGMRRGARNYLVLAGAARNAKRRPLEAGSARVRLPGWATERARELAEEALTTIRASGVRAVGDLDLLLPAHADPGAPAAPAPDLRLDPGTAAAVALGVAYGTGLRLGPDQPQDDLIPLPFVSTPDLLRILGGRGRAWLTRTRSLGGLPED